VSITLRGKDQARTIQLTGTGSLFTIHNSLNYESAAITLILDQNITLKRVGSNTDELVEVNKGGTLEMRDGAKITGNSNTATNSGGGGVYNSFDFTIFTKTGGTIYGDTDTTHTAGSTENTATSGNGHAVYNYDGGKKRNSTAGPGVNLDSGIAANWE
jgi:hypothetical protein